MTEIELELFELAASNARACRDEHVSPDDVDVLVAEVRRLNGDLVESRSQRNEAQGAAMAFGADNEQLRGLVKSVEWAASTETPGGDASCPWCSAENGVRERGVGHAPDCPAFTEDGTVR